MTATADTRTRTPTGHAGPTMAITDISIDQRYRRHHGRLRELQQSIRADGLLRPVPVTADGVLLGGERRLRACRNLGWDRIPVVIATDDAHAVALIGADEKPGICDKRRSASELILIGLHVEDLERTQAEERRAAGRAHQLATSPHRKTRTLTAEIAGMSQHYYYQIRAVVLAADGVEGAPGGHRRTQVDPEWQQHSREVLELINRVHGGEEIRRQGPTGQRRLTINAVYAQWVADRTRHHDAVDKNSVSNEAAGAQPVTVTSHKVMSNAVATLTGLCHGLGQIDGIDPAITKDEAASFERDLATASRILRTLQNKIKEHRNGIA